MERKEYLGLSFKLLVKSALHYGKCELNTLEAQFESELLLMAVWNKDRAYLFSHFSDVIPENTFTDYCNTVFMRKNGKPLYYIIGKKPFYNISVKVDESVLIPRPESELLVETSLEFIKRNNRNTSILDMCTGSGAIAVAIAHNSRNAEIHAVDISRYALKIAVQNVKEYSLENKITCYRSDGFSEVSEKYDLIVSNPPYVPTESLCKCSQDVLKEPLLALDGGMDGMVFIRRLVRESVKYLKNNGLCLFEIAGDFHQKPAMKLLSECGFKKIFTLRDLAGFARVCGGYYV